MVSPAACAAIQNGISATSPSALEASAAVAHQELRRNKPHVATVNPDIGG